MQHRAADVKPKTVGQQQRLGMSWLGISIQHMLSARNIPTTASDHHIKENRHQCICFSLRTISHCSIKACKDLQRKQTSFRKELWDSVARVLVVVLFLAVPFFIGRHSKGTLHERFGSYFHIGRPSWPRLKAAASGLQDHSTGYWATASPQSML